MLTPQDTIDTATCPVCHKTFKITEEHKYIINKDFTCSWKCFHDYVFSHTKDKNKNKKVEEEVTPSNIRPPEKSSTLEKPLLFKVEQYTRNKT